MDKQFLKFAAAAMLAAASTGALATDGSVFVNVEAGGSNYDLSNSTDNTGSAYAGRLGYLWHLNGSDVGVEAGYVDLGKASADDYYSGAHAEAKVDGTLLGVNARLPLDKWFLSARLGWFHSSSTEHVTAGSASASASANGDGTYAGIGFGFDFSSHASLSINFDNYQSKAEGIFTRRFNTALYGATLEYRF